MMPENPITTDDVEAAFRELLDRSTEAVVPALEALAEAQEKRAARLAGAQARLTASLGASHPKVVALREAAVAASELKTSLDTAAVRERHRPRLKPHEWMVFGRVLDASGNPVSSLRVRVFDRDRKYDDLLGDTVTDEFGDFAVVYHERDFAEVGEGLPELYVMVSDAKGSTLYSSRDSVRIESGRAEYFEIVLGQKPASEAPSPKPRRAPKATADKDKTTRSKRRTSPKG